jgi:hypothetical protein
VVPLAVLGTSVLSGLKPKVDIPVRYLRRGLPGNYSDD